MSNMLASSEPVGTYTSGLINVIGYVICDSFYDLPAANDYNSDGVQLVMGSRAEIIDTGDIYKMDSNGVWMLQPDPSSITATVGLDLTGYYTATQTDAAIANANILKFANIQNIPNDTDINTLDVGVYFKSVNVNTLTNLPTGFSSAFKLVCENTLGTNRRRQTILPCTQATAVNTYYRIETSGGWQPWYVVTGTLV